MDQQWTETFREEIGAFAETIDAFDRGELDRKAYKGRSGGFGTYAQRDPSRHMLRLRLAGDFSCITLDGRARESRET